MVNKLQEIPFTVIIDAIHGDEAALELVLHHYKRYICSLSTKTVIDSSGVHHVFLDENMKAHLENKLIYSIVTKFKLPTNR